MGASVYGGGGNDSILADKLDTASGSIRQRKLGNDTIQGANADGEETIYGGQGNDLISNAGNDGERFYYGDKGNDSITLVSTDASLASGGDGADSIVFSSESANTTEKFHSIDGGAGVDTISVNGTASGDATTNYLVDKEATRLYYSSFAEFLSQGDVVDSITISGANQAAVAVISEELTITDSDEFDRIDTSGGGTATGGVAGTARDAVTEGLILQTASSVKAGSTIVFDNAASEYLGGVDLSAGTTGNSTIDNSADTTGGTIGILMAGGEGRNTIKGGSGNDVIIGGSKNDLLVGNIGTDKITTDAGKDTVDGGAGNDSIVMSTNLTNLDSIVGGGDTDSLSFTDSNSAATDLDGVSGVEIIKLGDATSVITLSDNVASSDLAADLFIDASSLDSTTVTLTLDASNETAQGISVVGGTGADVITGGAGNDTIVGNAGADTIDVDDGTTDVVVANLIASTDTITNWTAGASKDKLAIDVSAINALVTNLIEVTGNHAVAAADTPAFTAAISATGALGTGKNIVLLGGTTVAANETILNGSTTNADFTDGDALVVAFIDGASDLNIGIATVDSDSGTDGTIENASINVTQTFTGTYTLAGLDATNFAFI